MKTSQITFIANSLTAREILTASKAIPSNRKSSVAKWLESASDEDIADIATQAGWSETANTPVADVVIDSPEGATRETLVITDSKGNQVPVDVYQLPFTRTKREWIYKGGVKDRRQIAFQFQFGNITIKTHSNLLVEMLKNGDLVKGDIIPFKADTCLPTHVPARNGNKAYTFWEGATLEAGSELLQDARESIEAREDDMALMSKEAQAMLTNMSAEAQVKAFMAKHGA